MKYPISKEHSNSFHKWKFGTINIRSGKEKSEGAKMYSITKEISRVNLIFCALEEVRYRNTGKKLIETDSEQKYQFMWCGQTQGCRGWVTYKNRSSNHN